MNDLALHIEYLLLRHDCVIVPGLGAFLAHKSGAKFDESTGMLVPPARLLGFNSELTHNDGLLVESVARRERKTLEASRMQVEKAVTSFLYQLKESGALPVGNLGNIVVNSETGSLLFEPDLDNDLINLPDCGLLPVALRPLEEEKECHVAAQNMRISSPSPRRGRLAWIAASVVAVLVMVGVAINRPDQTSVERHEYASIDSGLRSNMGKVISSEVEKTLEISREIILNIASPAAEEPVEKAAPARNTDKYLLVVGSFPSQRAAEKFAAADSSLSVIEMDGKFRVYAATAATLNAAHSKSNELASSYPNVWVCRR